MNELGAVNPPAIYGDAVAGQEDKKVRSALENLINTVNKSNFDIAELLHTVKSKGYFMAWGYTTFKDYSATLNLKDRKVQYLTKIVETFAAVGVDRKEYEPLGIARCREISSLDPSAIWTNPESKLETPMKEFIVGFVEKGEEIDMDTLKQHVRTLKGFVGENDLTWINICIKRSVLDNTIRPALELAKNFIGSVAKDSEGISQDASDGTALEMIAVEYLNDPANNVLPEAQE